MKIAILGCGSIGRRHIQNLLALGCSDIIAFDPLPAVCMEIEKKFHVCSITKKEEVWRENPDVVFVTSPTNSHVPLALEAAYHDCHLFIEKPLSHNLDGVVELILETNHRNLVSMVGCNMRFHPGPVEVKRLIDRRAVGKVIASRIETGSYLPNWRPNQSYRDSYSASALRGGGAILDCIHEVDLALWYFGPGVVAGAASRSADSLGLQVEGLAEILIDHQSDVLSSVHLNFVQRDYHRSCQVLGTDGSLYWDFEHGKVRWYNSISEWQVFDQPADWVVNQMYVDELKYFLSQVEQGATTFNSLEEARATLEIALRAKEQIEQSTGEEII